MSAGFRIAVLFGGFVSLVTFSYLLALLGSPEHVWIWQLAGAL